LNGEELLADAYKNKFYGRPRQLNFGAAYTSGNAEHGFGADFRLLEVTANCFLRVRTKVRSFVEENFKLIDPAQGADHDHIGNEVRLL
jgi:hypothetical protein